VIRRALFALLSLLLPYRERDPGLRSLEISIRNTTRKS
jgi:hypothetical protein